MKRTLILFLLTLTVLSLSGCKKDKQEEPTSPTLEVIEPETTEPEVLETLPEAETRKAGEGKSLEELSEEAGIPVIETRALNDESLSEDGHESSKENSTNAEGTSLSGAESSSSGKDTSESGTDTSKSDNTSNNDAGSQTISQSDIKNSELQENNGGDTEVVGIDQEVFNEMQDKYSAEMEAILNNPENIKKMEEIENGGK